MHFGYLNRNYVETPTIPVGPNNIIEPGGPDRGQPTFFYTRTNRNLFTVNVPKDWPVNRDVIWTLTVNGKTQKAFGWLQARMGNRSGRRRGRRRRQHQPRAHGEQAAQRCGGSGRECEAPGHGDADRNHHRRRAAEAAAAWRAPRNGRRTGNAADASGRRAGARQRSGAGARRARRRCARGRDRGGRRAAGGAAAGALPPLALQQAAGAVTAAAGPDRFVDRLARAR